MTDDQYYELRSEIRNLYRMIDSIGRVIMDINSVLTHPMRIHSNQYGESPITQEMWRAHEQEILNTFRMSNPIPPLYNEENNGWER